MLGAHPMFSWDGQCPLLALCSRTGLIMGPAVTLKPWVCPLCAAGGELCRLLQDFVPQSERYEKLGASGWELDGGTSARGGVCSGGMLVGMEIQPHHPEQLLFQGGLADGELLRLLQGH